MHQETSFTAAIAGGVILLLASLTSHAECNAPATWFPANQTERPDDNADFNTNCDFHQWSWQMFLWLTQPVSGGLRFETMPTPEDAFSLFEQDDPRPLNFKVRRKAPKQMKLGIRPAKFDASHSLQEIHQAGSKGLLIDQNGRATYYSQHINDIFYNFIVSNQYYDPAIYKAAPADKNYPVGTLELKAAWRILGEGESTTGLYTRRAELDALSTDADGKVIVDPSKTLLATVTLVGLHVVGVVKDHPEFIWATFEHIDNSPELPLGMDPKSNDPVSARDWTYYAANTAAKDCNVNNAGTVVLVDPDKQILRPITQVYLHEAFGGGSRTNMANIMSLNQSVHMQLAANSMWKGHDLIGAVWLLPNSLVPNSNLQPPAVQLIGSDKLSNATMETFTQQLSFQNNCFACHNTQTQFPPSSVVRDPLPGKNMNISHAMVDGYWSNLERAQQSEAREIRENLMKEFMSEK